MKIFGLTGGIACGKSHVTKTLRAHGIPMVDADVVARQVVVPGSEGLRQVIKTFGPEFLLADGNLNREKLGNLVFSDSYARSKINQIMGPLIDREAANQIDSLQLQGHQLIGYDAALIIETGHADKYRPLVVVFCSAELQMKRLMGRGLTEEQARNRIESQMPVTKKVALADYSIDTSGSYQDTAQQTEAVILKLKEKRNFALISAEDANYLSGEPVPLTILVPGIKIKE